MANIKSDLDEKRVLVSADIKKLISSGSWSVDVPPGATYWRIDKAMSIWIEFNLAKTPPTATTPILSMTIHAAHQTGTDWTTLVSSGWEKWTNAIAWSSNGTAITADF
jgi:hypothetical protein